MKLLPVLAVVMLCAATLTGCIGDDARSTSEWLEQQSGVVDVQTLDSTVDDVSYSATFRAELEPDITDKQVIDLVANSFGYLDEHDGDDVALRFGLGAVDFGAETTTGLRGLVSAWRVVSGVPNMVAALVTSGGVQAQALRANALTVYDDLLAIAPYVQVDASHAMTDFDESSADFRPPAHLTGSQGCQPLPGARELIAEMLIDPALDFGSLDLCDGVDVLYTYDYPLADAATALSTRLRAAGLESFPVTIGMSPELPSSPDFHSVAVTPGDPAALAVVASLEASPIPIRYELDGSRDLAIESFDVTLAELLAAVPAAGASLGMITLTASDGTVTGSFAELPGLVAAS